jgi:hypothetical protein
MLQPREGQAMRTWSQTLFGVTVSALSVAGSHVVGVSAWSDMCGEQTPVLLPNCRSWNLIPVRETAVLVQIAWEYASLPRDMQYRPSARLVARTALSAQRGAAREHYRHFRSLPQGKRRDLMNKWKKQYLG